MISDYLAVLSGKLSFDPGHSERIREEIEDHLREAAAAEAGLSPAEAERRAIQRFGSANEIATQFAGETLMRRARAIRLVASLALAVVFLTMRLRAEWFHASQDVLLAHEGLRLVGLVASFVDRYAFILAICIALVSWMPQWQAGDEDPADDYRASRCRRSLVLFAFGAMALAASIAAGGVLVLARTPALGWSWQVVLPVLAGVIEIVIVGVLMNELRKLYRSFTSAKPLLPA